MTEYLDGYHLPTVYWCTGCEGVVSYGSMDEGLKRIKAARNASAWPPLAIVYAAEDDSPFGVRVAVLLTLPGTFGGTSPRGMVKTAMR